MLAAIAERLGLGSQADRKRFAIPRSLALSEPPQARVSPAWLAGRAGGAWGLRIGPGRSVNGFEATQAV
jgi:hypothetical protein